MEVARTRRGVSLYQRKYALDVLEDAGFLGAKPVFFSTGQNLRSSNLMKILLTTSNMYF